MLEVKTWLESAGEPVEETCFPPGDVPQLPYVVFLDTAERGGGDMRNLMKTHSLTVERYSETNDYNESLEALFDSKAIKFKREQQWVNSIECYMTTYEFDLIEREVI
jgi:hypothetical protein